MRFSIKNLRESLGTLSRKIGYRFLGGNAEKKEWSFVRVLGSGGYPRFHLFVSFDSDKKNWSFNLHLDQKRPVYRGAPAHAGEYDSDVVKTEAERIKEVLRR